MYLVYKTNKTIILFLIKVCTDAPKTLCKYNIAKFEGTSDTFKNRTALSKVY